MGGPHEDDFARAQLGNIIVALPNKLQKFEEFTPGAYDFTTEAPLLKNLFAFDSVANSHYISIDNPGGGDPYAWVELGGAGGGGITHPDRSGELFATGSGLYYLITGLSGDLFATGSGLYGLITGLSGDLEATGSDLYSLITGLSGELDITGADLYGYITGLSGRLDATGLDLYQCKTGLSGELHGYITSLSGQLDATGQLLLSAGGDNNPDHVTHAEAIAYAIIFG